MAARETFSSRWALLASMIGVAVGLGNVWRFPYMVGSFGGASFVLVYVAAVVLLGLPALVAEWTLGRETRRGTVGAFERAGLPFGRAVGWFFFFVVAAATAYYTDAVGWVLFHALCETLALVGLSIDGTAILPPERGFSWVSFVLQLACTATIILGCAWVLLRGLRAGIERASRVIVPLLGGIVLVVVVRTLTLPGAWEGVRWYLLKFDLEAIDGSVVAAAVGQAIFSLSLGGTFMVVYGSYLDERQDLLGNAGWTAGGDLIAGLLAGLAIIPAVIALGLPPGEGPGLLFSTLPRVFEQIPLGALVGALFFLGLLGAAYLSDVAAFEVLVAGLVDNTRLTRSRAVWSMAALVFLLAIPPMINLEIFVPWDLLFGSGMQTLGALAVVVTVGWFMDRRSVLRQFAGSDVVAWHQRLLLGWVRYVVPLAILFVGIWWLLSDVLGWIRGV